MPCKHSRAVRLDRPHQNEISHKEAQEAQKRNIILYLRCLLRPFLVKACNDRSEWTTDWWNPKDQRRSRFLHSTRCLRLKASPHSTWQRSETRADELSR